MNGFQNSRATFDPIDRLKLGPVPEHPIVQKDKAKLKLGEKPLQHKPSKYHYHMRVDQIYGDKTLKLCGQCTRPGNLASDLRYLDENMIRGSGVWSEATATSLSSKDTMPAHPHLNKASTRDLFDLHRTSLRAADPKFKIDFDVIDLTSERQSGPNLPILSLPPDLFRFRHLKRLHLDCNRIKVLPDELGENLVGLETLTVSNNSLKGLPPSLAKLQQLSSIHLSGNELEKFPPVLCQIESLRFLDLTSNELSAIDPNIDRLKDLEALLLFKNRIRELPPQIGRLTALRTLWLGHNKITKLPREITFLKRLEWSNDFFDLSANIDKNPLQEPPIDVCLQGMDAITDYFKNRDSEEQM